MLAVGADSEGDDLVQTTMARVFSRMDSYRGEASFWVWVDRIAINAVRDHFRKRRWTWLPLLEEAPPPQARPVTRPDTEVERYRLMRRLSDHMSGLKPAQRMPLILTLVHGYTVPETAALLELSFEATKKRLLRGRKELLRRVSRDPYCQAMLLELAG